MSEIVLRRELVVTATEQWRKAKLTLIEHARYSLCTYGKSDRFRKVGGGSLGD